MMPGYHQIGFPPITYSDSSSGDFTPSTPLSSPLSQPQNNISERNLGEEMKSSETGIEETASENDNTSSPQSTSSPASSSSSVYAQNPLIVIKNAKTAAGDVSGIVTRVSDIKYMWKTQIDAKVALAGWQSPLVISTEEYNDILLKMSSVRLTFR